MLINGHRLKIYRKPLSKQEFIENLRNWQWSRSLPPLHTHPKLKIKRKKKIKKEQKKE